MFRRSTWHRHDLEREVAHQAAMQREAVTDSGRIGSLTNQVDHMNSFAIRMIAEIERLETRIEQLEQEQT